MIDRRLSKHGPSPLEAAAGPAIDAVELSAERRREAVQHLGDRVGVGTFMVPVVRVQQVVRGDVQPGPVDQPAGVARDQGLGLVRIRVVSEAQQAEHEVRTEQAVVGPQEVLERPAGGEPAAHVQVVGLVHGGRVVDHKQHERLGHPARGLLRAGGGRHRRRGRALHPCQRDGPQQPELHAHTSPCPPSLLHTAPGSVKRKNRAIFDASRSSARRGSMTRGSAQALHVGADLSSTTTRSDGGDRPAPLGSSPHSIAHSLSSSTHDLHGRIGSSGLSKY